MNYEDKELIGYMHELSNNNRIVIRLKRFIDTYNQHENYHSLLHVWLQENKHLIIFELEKKWNDDIDDDTDDHEYVHIHRRTF